MSCSEGWAPSLDLLGKQFFYQSDNDKEDGATNPARADIAENATDTTCTRDRGPQGRQDLAANSPPRTPTSELPTGPRVRFFISAPAMLPPTAPLVSWMITGIRLSTFFFLFRVEDVIDIYILQGF
jgi:hypothetical protein